MRCSRSVANALSAWRGADVPLVLGVWCLPSWATAAYVFSMCLVICVDRPTLDAPVVSDKASHILPLFMCDVAPQGTTKHRVLGRDDHNPSTPACQASGCTNAGASHSCLAQTGHSVRDSRQPGKLVQSSRPVRARNHRSGTRRGCRCLRAAQDKGRPLGIQSPAVDTSCKCIRPLLMRNKCSTGSNAGEHFFRSWYRSGTMLTVIGNG